jgi:chemotaxis response regulator CheB
MIRKTSSNPKKLTAIKQKSRINPSIPSHQPVDPERTLFPVVGIGVLATELSSLRQFFTRMPADSGAAFVVIQQSDATQGNLSPQQLQDVTSMKIVHVENLIEVQPDCVYIVEQSSKNVFISNGFLCVLNAEPGHVSNSLIDFFFHSLAEEYRESAVGVIFSGSGANGTQGLRAIRKKGGLGLTQDSMSSEPGGICRIARLRQAQWTRA